MARRRRRRAAFTLASKSTTVPLASCSSTPRRRAQRPPASRPSHRRRAKRCTWRRGEERKLELHFALPPESELPNESLDEIELTWRLTLNGHECRGRALFKRAGFWSGPAYWRDPWYDPWYGPWRGDPWCEPFGFHAYGWYGRVLAP